MILMTTIFEDDSEIRAFGLYDKRGRPNDEREICENRDYFNNGLPL